MTTIVGQLTRRMRGVFIAATVVALAVFPSACSREKQEEEIIGAETEKADNAPLSDGNSAIRPLRITGGRVISPRAGFVYYRRLFDYIGRKLDRPIEYVERGDYAEVNALFENREVDAAFVCSRPYVEGRDRYGMELLVAPLVRGRSVYYSYIITHLDSTAANLSELRGRTFAFSDPLSNSGKLAPTYFLSRAGETPDSFFSRHIYTYAHDRTIKLVAQKVCDGGAVDSLIWEYWNKENPQHTSKTKIIQALGPFGIPPVVARKELDAETKLALRTVLLHAHEDAECKKILSSMMIDRFVTIDDSAYDSIREMMRAVNPEEAVEPAKDTKSAK